PTAGIVNKLNISPEIDFSLPIGDLVKDMAKKQIEENSQFQTLPQAMRNQLIVKATKEIETQISDFFGVPTESKSTISEMLYKAMVDKFNKMPKNIKNIILIGIAALIFLTIEGIAWPIRWLVSVLAWLVYEILLAAGFATIVLEKKSREIVILK
ncbi:MAG: hypothetical protein AAB516_02450, partial [Patescibacteria group bacterium]